MNSAETATVLMAECSMLLTKQLRQANAYQASHKVAVLIILLNCLNLQRRQWQQVDVP